ncbi:MAG: hypothetical protein HFH62_06865 [Lachnospiraceae bacterium]|nr:hypothetical protein [Lachnospiraceae bacterium]
MKSKIGNIIRDLEGKVGKPELLTIYAEEFMRLHHRYASMKMMMEYYMFYEMVSEGINPYISSAEDSAETFHGLLSRYLEGPSDEELQQMAEKLLSLRGEIVDKMQVLTAYVDCFVVYEYILNRVQYRFDDMELMPGDGVFAQDLVNFIFSSEDNTVISDKIRFAVGQLPMRMTRQHYFDLVRDSVSVYQGSDVGTLEGFLYMFRTNAMLYRDGNQEKYFTEFVPVLEELSALDYENISEEAYAIYAEKIRVNASKLNDVADLYMQLGQLVNELYTMCVARKAAPGEAFLPEAERVLRGVNALFRKEDSPVWQQAEDTPVGNEEEKLYWLGEQFLAVEGMQEQLFEKLGMAGAALEGIEESYRDKIEAAGLEEDFCMLNRLSLLVSNSVFADLEDTGTQEKVTREMADRAAAELIEECKAFFQGKSRMLRRAVMANTLEKMPVFFTSAQEVADYVTDSLSSCNDEAEKYAAKQLLMDMIK